MLAKRTLGASLLVIFSLLAGRDAAAAPRRSCAAPRPVLLRDIGVLGLASHDVFQWDRSRRANLENSRFDLSTIFDYEGGARWQTGGNPKNSENAPVYTITMRLVGIYADTKTALTPWFGEEGASKLARRVTVGAFIGMIADSYGRMYGAALPLGTSSGVATLEEQAAFRALHDILPGEMTLQRPEGDVVVAVTDFRYARVMLSDAELDQPLPAWDGAYDPNYLAIATPGGGPTINLKEVDREFIESNTGFNQASMLAELAEVGADRKDFEDVSFAAHLRRLYDKGMYARDNEWSPFRFGR